MARYDKKISAEAVAEKLIAALKEGNTKPVSAEVWEEIEKNKNFKKTKDISKNEASE